MILEKLHIIITIIAAIIMTVVCIVMKFSLEYSGMIIVLTIIGFYIVGSFISYYVNTSIFKKDIPAADTAENADEGSNGGEASEDNPDTDGNSDSDNVYEDYGNK